jgi:hypothetical protein
MPRWCGARINNLTDRWGCRHAMMSRELESKPLSLQSERHNKSTQCQRNRYHHAVLHRARHLAPVLRIGATPLNPAQFRNVDTFPVLVTAFKARCASAARTPIELPSSPPLQRLIQTKALCPAAVETLQRTSTLHANFAGDRRSHLPVKVDCSSSQRKRMRSASFRESTHLHQELV